MQRSCDHHTAPQRRRRWIASVTTLRRLSRSASRAAATASALCAALVITAFDLSSVPAASRGRVVVAWYNDPTTNSYDHNFVGILRPVGIANDIPASYTIEGNAALGGSLPALGWVTLASVSGNSYHSRQ